MAKDCSISTLPGTKGLLGRDTCHELHSSSKVKCSQSLTFDCLSPPAEELHLSVMSLTWVRNRYGLHTSLPNLIQKYGPDWCFS